MFARFVRFAILRLVMLFYPYRELEGRERLPASGPIIFVLNHPNGLFDPMVLMIALKRQVAFLAKSTLFANPLGRPFIQSFGALPVYRQSDEGKAGGAQGDAAERNEAMFARCRALLKRGEAIALFPEGTTHSGTTLLPLRTGAARIALSAEAATGWQLRAQVVPVGLWYQNKTLFRSSVLLVIGQPFTLESFAAEYAADERQAVRALTERIDAALDTVVLQAENAELLRGAPLLARWIDPNGETATLYEQRKQAATLIAAYERLNRTDPARLEAIAQQARRYARVLRTLGVHDPWALELADIHSKRIGRLFSYVVLGFLPAVAGFALSYGPYRLAAPVTPYIVGRYDEVTSTGKVIVGAVFVLLGWILAAVICGVLFGALWGIVLFIAAPPLAYVALRWGEWWGELREVLAYNWLRLRHRELVESLVARRRALAEQVMEAVQLAEMQE